MLKKKGEAMGDLDGRILPVLRKRLSILSEVNGFSDINETLLEMSNHTEDA